MQIDNVLSGAVLRLGFHNPPVNALSIGSGFVSRIKDSVSRAIDNSSVNAIVLFGLNDGFSAGADTSELDLPAEKFDFIRELTNLVESSPKLIIAAIEGVCLGGGLELAISAHYRIATNKATFAFPEVTLGLLPGAGGTQRATRLIGATQSLDLLLSGKLIAAKRALEIGLVDSIVEGDPVAAAVDRFNAGDWGVPRRCLSLKIPGDIESAVGAVRNAGRQSRAGQKILECVEATRTHSPEDALSLERNAFNHLLHSSSSRALRHIYSGRKMVARVPGSHRVDTLPIRSVTVVGGGLMGTGIAIALLNSNLRVAVVEYNERARNKCYETIHAAIGRDLEKGRIDHSVSNTRLEALTVCSTIEAARGADLFIEAVYETLDAKRDVLKSIDSVAGPDALIASNTSTLDVDVLASFTSCPARVLGLHFFSPANVMRLLEIVRGAKTSVSTLATAMSFAKSIGKTGVIAGVCDGFIGNRIFEEYLRQAWFLLEEGALPEQIDRALQSFGMAMGPCRVMDLAGQDIGWSIRKRRAIEQPLRPYSKIPDLLCEVGRFGQKVGAGFYSYADSRTPTVDSYVSDLVVAESRRIGIERRAIQDSEIVDRCIYAMVNEGSRILEERVALRPVDIDIVYTDGYGFPKERGGPMFYADQIGLSNILQVMRGYESGRHGWAWIPSKLLIDISQRSLKFDSMNK